MIREGSDIFRFKVATFLLEKIWLDRFSIEDFFVVSFLVCGTAKYPSSCSPISSNEFWEEDGLTSSSSSILFTLSSGSSLFSSTTFFLSSVCNKEDEWESSEFFIFSLFGVCWSKGERFRLFFMYICFNLFFANRMASCCIFSFCSFKASLIAFFFCSC